MSTMPSKNVVSQRFGEQSSNLIFGACGENFDFLMVNMFTKMVIACYARLEFEEPFNF